MRFTQRCFVISIAVNFSSDRLDGLSIGSLLTVFSSFSVIKEEVPDNDQEQGNEEAEVE